MHFRKSRPKLPILAGIMGAVSNGLKGMAEWPKYYQDRIKCPVVMNESEVEMVISTALKPVFILCFGHFTLSW